MSQQQFKGQGSMPGDVVEKYTRAAQRLYHNEGTIEVDDRTVISRSDDPESGGAYVQAWVWVSDTEAGVDRNLEAGS